MSRIGVFICYCGSNIAGTVDVEAVAEAARLMPNVVYTETNKYTCSDPGQASICAAIKEHNLDRIVIGSCSPRMHEATFRKMLADKTDLNPYMLEIANLREQCSWVHKDMAEGTPKAIQLIAMAVAKVDTDLPLHTTQIPVTPRALIVGGGIAGCQAALDIADAGYEVTVVERTPSLGGKMVMLDKTFPTMDCSACICTPKMSEVGNHPNITVRTLADIEKVEGYIGNFEVTIREHAKYIDYDKCTGCGACETKCPMKVPSEFNQGMSDRKAIYKPFAQAVPAKPTIDPEHCRMLTAGKCGLCSKICPTGAIKYDDEDRLVTERFGAVIIATGYELIDWASLYGEYGGGRFADVITGLQFERLVNASGPTEGHILRPSDSAEPKTTVIIKCVGSRDPHKGVSYCSRACCMYSAKHAHQYLDKVPDGRCYVFYMDVRCAGKAYDEFYMNTLHDGAVYVRGRVSQIYQEHGKLVCLGEDTLSGQPVRVDADLVVLETAMVPPEGSDQVAKLFNTQRGLEGWFTEGHAKLRPVETNTGGIYLAGTAQGPKDIPDTVAQAGAAASKVVGLFNRKAVTSNPMLARVDVSKCSGCGACVDVCPYHAPSLVEVTLRENSQKVTRTVAQINEGLCQGCGACSVACRPGAMDLMGFSDEGVMQEVETLCHL
ncbi:MAG: CoB--CoM heterodisulfide reductase iron-sulfur subunit A family protein [Coriobacteriales bacterium]|nr:CoB--CoM heterodisulfide reductase iron-sulfur subunit A family protein [Coriobacteriales bacterium]